jgi:hypothetical protein
MKLPKKTLKKVEHHFTSKGQIEARALVYRCKNNVGNYDALKIAKRMLKNNL